jgi:hypothetical protein
MRARDAVFQLLLCCDLMVLFIVGCCCCCCCQHSLHLFCMTDDFFILLAEPVTLGTCFIGKQQFDNVTVLSFPIDILNRCCTFHGVDPNSSPIFASSNRSGGVLCLSAEDARKATTHGLLQLWTANWNLLRPA